MNEHELYSLLKERYGKVNKTTGGWLQIPCPTCTPKNARKMKRYVSVFNLYNKCWICETPLSKEELIGNTVINYKPTLKVEDVEKQRHPLADKIPYRRAIPINELPPAHPAVKFLNKDHLHDLNELYKSNGIVYVPVDGGYIFRTTAPYTTSAERIIFPVHYKGNFVGWQMRSVPGTFYGDRPDVVRYYHLFDKGKFLYNYDNAIKEEMVVLTEGAKKALKFKCGVATLGKSITSTQLQLLQNWKYVVVMLDTEKEAQEIALSCVEQLNNGTTQAINVNLAEYGYESPDEATSEELAEITIKAWQQRHT